MVRSRQTFLLGIAACLAGCANGSERQVGPEENKAVGIHAANCSTPPSTFGTQEYGRAHLIMVVEFEVDSGGRITTYGREISTVELTDSLETMASFRPLPHAAISFAPGLSCDKVEAIRSIFASASLCKDAPKICLEGDDPRDWNERLPY